MLRPASWAPQAGAARRQIDAAGLIERVASSRDREAFRELFQAFAPSVKGFLIRQGSDPQSAEELAQETLLAVWRKAGLYSRDRGSPATWVYTIARNLRIDRLRRETPWQELGDSEAEQADDGPLADDLLASEQVQRRVRRVLAELPPDQLEVVNLSYLEGLSHSEIAERLSLPLGTVKSRMRLAYEKIRAAFEDAT